MLEQFFGEIADIDPVLDHFAGQSKRLLAIRGRYRGDKPE